VADAPRTRRRSARGAGIVQGEVTKVNTLNVHGKAPQRTPGRPDSRLEETIVTLKEGDKIILTDSDSD